VTEYKSEDKWRVPFKINTPQSFVESVGMM
jgi:hypothetical protein